MSRRQLPASFFCMTDQGSESQLPFRASAHVAHHCLSIVKPFFNERGTSLIVVTIELLGCVLPCRQPLCRSEVGHSFFRLIAFKFSQSFHKSAIVGKSPPGPRLKIILIYPLPLLKCWAFELWTCKCPWAHLHSPVWILCNSAGRFADVAWMDHLERLL